MAVKKAKSKTKRRRSTSSVGAPPQTKTFGGKRYQHLTCSASKTEAKKKADGHRSKGAKKNARVVKTGAGYCVYTRG